MKKYIVANWKMHMNRENVNHWLTDWKTLANHQIDNVIIVAPSFLHLSLFTDTSQIFLAGQDISENEKGSHTGDVASFQLKDYCQYCIVGHSERSEKKEAVIKKAQRCIEAGIKPIICFANPHQAGEYLVDGAMLTWEDPSNISVDGVFRPKNPEEIAMETKKIRSLIPLQTVLLYGGSVNESNISAINAISELNGVLVGAASLNAQSFYNIATAK